MVKIYNLFISHSWSYSDQYDKLISLLNSDNSFYYKNYSVPKDDPIHNASSEKELRSAIKNQILPTSCVVILAGLYANYSKWINIEIELAKEFGKNIIAVEYWGSEKTSTVVKDNADLIVRWNAASIINAIKQLCQEN